MEEFLIQLNLEVMNDFNTHHHLICRPVMLKFQRSAAVPIHSVSDSW